VGHVSLPSPGEGGPDTLRDYLRAAHAAMAAVEATDAACGWIVDLRDYGGGGWGPPMWALGGLLDPGRAVTFSSPGGEWGLDVGPDGVVTAAGFEAVDAAASPYIDTSFEHASDDAFVAVRDDEPPYLPSVASPPVAVLVGNGTASGGEQAAVAFLGRPNTRTFGGPTGGSPIVAPNLPMLDGAVLRMPIWVPADREGERYTTNIMPDEVIGDTRSTGTDAVLDAALEWLEGQPGCS
jgi:C-terminal processing protease CtpA/Prc